MSIRVAVSHNDPEHANSEVAHYGPSFDAAYAETASHVLGTASVDLVDEARKCRDRFLAEHPGDGWTASIVRLNADGTWETVE